MDSVAAMVGKLVECFFENNKPSCQLLRNVLLPLSVKQETEEQFLSVVWFLVGPDSESIPRPPLRNQALIYLVLESVFMTLPTHLHLLFDQLAKPTEHLLVKW